MEQYIPKDALVAELKKRRDKNARNKLNLAAAFEDNYLLSFLDTLEVKEVDMDRAARHYLLHEHKSPLNEIFHQADIKAEMQYHKDIENAFKAGFELGLKVQSKDMIEALRTEYEKGRADMIIEIEECFHKAITADAQACLIKGLLDKLKRKG